MWAVCHSNYYGLCNRKDPFLTHIQRVQVETTFAALLSARDNFRIPYREGGGGRESLMKLVWMYIALVDTPISMLPHIGETWPAVLHAMHGTMKTVKKFHKTYSLKLLTGCATSSNVTVCVYSLCSHWTFVVQFLLFQVPVVLFQVPVYNYYSNAYD